MKKRLLPLLLATLLLALTGCEDLDSTDPLDELSQFYRQENEQPEPEPLTAFTLPYVSGETLDPLTTTDLVQQTVGQLLYEGLFTLNEEFRPEPVLADTYTYDDDARTWTITLRSGIMFSDGSALTAQDVAASLNRARTSPRYGERLRCVTSVAAWDGTVVISLSEDAATLPSRLDIPIVKSGTETYTVPIGTGPYMFCKDNGVAYLSANTYWRQSTALPLQRIELLHCKDRDSALYAFSSREIQLLALDLTAASGTGVSGSGDYTDAPTAVMQFIGVNTRREALADPALRRALSAGIDRAGVVSSCLLGHGLAAQLPASPAANLYDASLETAYSAANYRQLLSAALGEDAAPLSLTLLVNQENSFKVSAAQEVAYNLSADDLTVTVEALPWEQFLQRLTDGEFDLYYGECRLTADWDVSALAKTNGALNYGGYSSERTDALLAAALSNTTQRSEALTALWRDLLDNAPFLPVCFKATSVLVTEGVVEGLAPTETDVFRHLDAWRIHLDA